MAEPGTTPIPAVSVVMPVYNAGPYLHEAIRSILAQTFTDFELIIVNDGSTDGSEAVVRGFDDPRIRYATQANQGVVGALNTGLELARADLIARHDADDVALPDRLSEQVAYMQAHPEVGLLGTWAIVTDATGAKTGVLHHPTAHAAITYALLFDTALVHPSVIFRRPVLDAAGPYSADKRIFEDHDMWCRMARITRAANIPHDLVLYRVVPSSASRLADREVRLVEQRRRNIAFVLPTIAARYSELIVHAGLRHSSIRWRELRAVQRILHKIIDDIGGTPDERAYMLADARARLMGFHLVARHGLLTRALDRAFKAIALALPTFGSRS